MAKKEIINTDNITLRVGEGAADMLDTAIEQTSEAIEIAEKALDHAEHAVERVVTVTRHNPWIIAGAFLVGAGLGGFIAYKIAEKRLAAKFDAELSEQIAAAKAYRSRVAKEGEFETPEGAVSALVPDEVQEAVRSYQGRPSARQPQVPYDKPEKVDPRPPVNIVAENVEVTENVTVVAKGDPRDWDYNAEVADRELNPEIPYTISFEEFNENNVGHEQTTMTYYAQDRTLADSQDGIVDNINHVIGDDNLRRFGHGSHDPNVVYVRNEKIDMDFEITRSNGSYQSEVLNIDPEPASLQHSRTRRPNRRTWRADE